MGWIACFGRIWGEESGRKAYGEGFVGVVYLFWKEMVTGGLRASRTERS